MKKIAIRFAVVLVATTFLFNCKKKEDESPKPASSQAATPPDYKTYNNISSAFTTISDDINKGYQDSTKSNQRSQSNCAQYSWLWDGKGKPVPGFGETYVKLTISFNGACEDGITRTGSMEVYFSGWGNTWKDSVSIKNLTVNGLAINGYRSSKYNAKLAAPNVNPYDVRIEGDVKHTNGLNYHYSATELNTWTGLTSFARSGTGYLKDNNSGATLFGAITLPMVTTWECSFFKFPVSGEIQYTSNIANGSKGTVNYGSGTCDQSAVYTDHAGTKTTFTLQ